MSVSLSLSLGLCLSPSLFLCFCLSVGFHFCCTVSVRQCIFVHTTRLRQFHHDRESFCSTGDLVLT